MYVILILQVLVFVNFSFKELDQFLPTAFSLLKIVVQKIIKSEAEQMHIVFGDNIRSICFLIYFL